MKINRANRLIATLIAFVLLVQPAIPYLEYALFRDYIAKELCQNRSTEKASSCQGKCWLKKELVKQTQQTPVDGNELTNSTVKLELNDFYMESLPTIPELHSSTSTLPYYKAENYTFTLHLDVFHPPETSA